MPNKIFMSHTKLDKKFCDDFDRVVARLGFGDGVFRSEFEKLESPAWRTILNEMRASKAMFLLVGNELVNAQARSEISHLSAESWKFTQNWISYEVGLACQLGIDVWVICDDVKINFPVPYLNNYEIYGIGSDNSPSFNFYRDILQDYKIGKKFPLNIDRTAIKCPYDNCGAEFNLRSQVPVGNRFACPSCLGEIEMHML
jgi:hypothetical protein